MSSTESPVIEYYSIYDVDVKEETCEEVELASNADGDLLKFLKKVALNTRASSSKRQASFTLNSPVKVALDKVVNNVNRDLNSKNIAQMLLDAEVIYGIKMERLNKELKKGSLVVTIFTMGSARLLMLSKIDFEKFLEKDTLKSTLGLPEEKALLKSCLIEIENNSMVEAILLADSNGAIAKYWWDEFLKSKLTFTDKENTQKAFSTLEQLISKVRNVSPDDHRDLRNNLISYFKTSNSYDNEQMIERVIGDFKPHNSEVDVEKIRKKFSEVPAKAKFDGNFEIDATEVRARAKKVYDLGNDIELITRSGTDNIYSITKDNDSYVAVRTQMNIDNFKKLN
jgi:adenylate cyclase class IV